MPESHHSVFYRPDALPAAQPTALKQSTADFFVTGIRHTYCLFFHVRAIKASDISQGSVAEHLSCDGVFNKILLEICYRVMNPKGK